MTRSDPRQDLELYLSALGFEKEYRFLPDRKFRADFRLGTLLVEYEGGVFAGGDAGGHRGLGRFLKDAEKYNLAAISGFRVIRVTAKHVESGEAFGWIEKAMEAA